MLGKKEVEWKKWGIERLRGLISEGKDDERSVNATGKRSRNPP